MVAEVVIERAGLVLRPPRLADAAEWLAGEDDEIVRWFEFPRPSTLTDVERAIERWDQSWKHDGPVRCWAVCDPPTGAIAGGVELTRLNETDVNLSYWVFKPWRGRGIATRAAVLALEYAMSDMHASLAVMKVLEGNTFSLALAHTVGGQRVGTMASDAGGTFVVFHRAL